MNAQELIATVRDVKSESASLPDREAFERLAAPLSEFVREPGNRKLPFSGASLGLYTRILLNAPRDPFQIVLVLWGPGSASPIHDHSGTVGAVAALVGETAETKFRLLDARRTPVRLEPADVTALRDGVVSPIFPDEATQLHEMANETDAWSATVHVYLTPIRRFNVYERRPDGSFTREPHDLWFDGENGWREMTADSAAV